MNTLEKVAYRYVVAQFAKQAAASLHDSAAELLVQAMLDQARKSAKAAEDQEKQEPSVK